MGEVVGGQVEGTGGEEMLAADAEVFVHFRIPVGFAHVDVRQLGGGQQHPFGRKIEHVQIPAYHDFVGIIPCRQQFPGGIIPFLHIGIGGFLKNEVESLFNGTVPVVYGIGQHFPGGLRHFHAGVEHGGMPGVHIKGSTAKIVFPQIIPDHFRFGFGGYFCGGFLSLHRGSPAFFRSTGSHAEQERRKQQDG